MVENKNYDIIFNQKLDVNEEIQKSSIISIFYEKEIFILKFNLSKDNLIDEWDLLFIEENSFLFFRETYEWVVFDLKNKKVQKRENAYCLPSFEKKEEVIIIYDELNVKCVDFNGNIINEVPVDPPYESEDFDDRIEFKSSVYGKTTLYFKKQENLKTQTLTERLLFFLSRYLN